MSDELDINTRKDKPWIHAAEVLEQSGKLEYGTVIEGDELRELLDAKIDPEKMMSGAEYTRLSWLFLKGFENLRDHLLLQKRVYLHNIRGHGYKVLEPKEQIDVGKKGFEDGFQKLAEKAMKILSNVEDEEINDYDRIKRDEYVMRVGYMTIQSSEVKKMSEAELRKKLEKKKLLPSDSENDSDDDSEDPRPA